MIKSIKFEFNLEQIPFNEGDTPMTYARRQLDINGYPEAIITDVSVDVQLLSIYHADKVLHHHIICQVLIVEIQVPM